MSELAYDNDTKNNQNNNAFLFAYYRMNIPIQARRSVILKRTGYLYGLLKVCVRFFSGKLTLTVKWNADKKDSLDKKNPVETMLIPSFLSLYALVSCSC